MVQKIGDLQRNESTYGSCLQLKVKSRLDLFFTIETDDSGLGIWKLFVLESLKSQKDNLEKKIERENIMVKLPVLSREIISIVKEHGQTTISDLEAITKTSKNTIKVRLKELVTENYLIRNGRGKSTWYTIGKRSLT